MDLMAAPPLHDRQVHLWRLPYQRCEGRMGLHAVLSRYLRMPEHAVVLEQRSHGRPVLGGEHAWLDFNWSHSGDHAVIALARRLPTLGVDVEIPRPRARAAELARRYFTTDESAWVDARPEPERWRRFVDLWTAKEAVLKGYGRGLAYGLDKVGFTGGDAPLRPAHFEGAIGAAADWHLTALEAAGLLGHVAWRGEDRAMSYVSGW